MDPQDLKPVVLITGCSQGGIGHALALEFAANNCRVVATSRSKKTMADLEDDPRFFLQELDVCSDQSVNDVVSNVVKEFGRIDILVNNAGVLCFGPIAELPLSSLEKSFNTNVYGAIRLVQAVFPHMASRRKGKIVNIGSISAPLGAPWMGAYVSSKAALHTLNDTLRMELGHFGIHVTNVVPGMVKSNIARAAGNSYKQLPEWKFYKPFEASIRRREDVSQTSKATPTEVFAKDAVAAVLKQNPPAWFSSGRYATVVAILKILPRFLQDFIALKSLEW